MRELFLLTFYAFRATWYSVMLRPRRRISRCHHQSFRSRVGRSVILYYHRHMPPKKLSKMYLLQGLG